MRVRRKLWIVKIVDTKNEVGCIINVLQEHISLDTVADVFNGKRNFGGNDCSHYKNKTARRLRIFERLAGTVTNIIPQGEPRLQGRIQMPTVCRRTGAGRTN